MEGVVATSVGYAGGRTADPTYSQVCSGNSGHTEVVEVVFDPARVGLDKLLQVFWDSHTPYEPCKSQYRSVVFYTTDAQRDAAQAYKAKLEKQGASRLATRIEPAPVYYLAEEYHQQYYEKMNPARGLFR